MSVERFVDFIRENDQEILNEIEIEDVQIRDDESLLLRIRRKGHQSNRLRTLRNLAETFYKIDTISIVCFNRSDSVYSRSKTEKA